jgi:hypothetical protein
MPESPSPETPDTASTVESVRSVNSSVQLSSPSVVPTDVAAFLSKIEERGVASTNIGNDASQNPVSAGGCLVAPSWSQQLAVGGLMIVFLYADAEEAKDAATSVPQYADCDGFTDWARDVYYFRYEKLIVFVSSENSHVYEVVEGMAGPRFACAQGFTPGPRLCERIS